MEKKYQLPRAFAEKWIDALRSGEYKQAKKLFKKASDCYCAVGLGYMVNGMNFDDMDLPLWNIEDEVRGHLYKSILTMNDEGAKTFPEIADWIEANVEFKEGVI